MFSSRLSAALRAALLAVVVVIAFASSGQAFRNPVTFSVLNDGVGQPTVFNDVLGLTPDGAHVFLSGVLYPGLWPDGNNRMIIPAPSIGLPDADEVDALSYGDDLVLPPNEVQGGVEIEFYFSVDAFAVGVPGMWPPDVASEAPMAAGDVYFAWPIPWPYGGNHLGVPEIILGLDPPTPDDLDALIFSPPGFPEPLFPVFFSVDRASCGLNGTAVWTQCNSPAPPAQAADVFLSYGNGTNGLFANESTMGLDWNDDNIDAMVVFDSSEQGIPNGLLDPGYDRIYFSVDWMTNGLPGTAVNVEALSGNIQGDIFFSDFTGWNWKLLDGSQLGLLEPMPPQAFTPDEDNLNALETEFWMDRDGDQIPDLVDNCPDDPNPMQMDADGNGMGDVCDPTDVNLGESPADRGFGFLGIEPNPFAERTRIRFAVAADEDVSLEVFGVDGRRVRTLASGGAGSAERVASWDGRDDAGRTVAAGVYWIRLNAGDRIASAKVVRIE